MCFLSYPLRQGHQRADQEGRGRSLMTIEKTTMILASRKSDLALTQSQWVRTELLKHHPDLEIKIETFVTRGDQILDVALAKVGGKGLFVKELELAMLERKADFAVHSMKDMPAVFPEGLGLVAVPVRHAPYDVLVSPEGYTLHTLPEGALVGTSSLRRSVLIKRLRPDVSIQILRGNVPTRVRRLMAGEFQAIILAEAGLARLGMDDLRRTPLDVQTFIPAVGQGALAIEARLDDASLLERLAVLNDPETFWTTQAERAFLKGVEGSCQVPIGAHATLIENDPEAPRVRIHGFVASPDGSIWLEDEMEGSPDEAGRALAHKLLERGARKVIAAWSRS